MEKFKTFTENLMKVILVPDNSSDAVSEIKKDTEGQTPFDNFSKTIADYMGGSNEESENELTTDGQDETQGEDQEDQGECPCENNEEAESDFEVFNDTNGLKITFNGMDFTFPPDIVEKIKDCLLSSTTSSEDTVENDDSESSDENEETETPAIENAMFGDEDQENDEDDEEEEDEDKQISESLVEDGYMSNMHDIQGLEKYLIEIGQIPSGSRLTTSEDSAASLRRKGYRSVFVMDSYEERGTWTLRVYDPLTEKEVYYYNSDTEAEEQQKFNNEEVVEGFVPFKKKNSKKDKKDKKSKKNTKDTKDTKKEKNVPWYEKLKK